MKEQLLNYIQSQLFQAPNRLRGQAADMGGRAYPHRHLFAKLEQQAQDFLAGTTEQRWVMIPGLRGVGKTTVMSQLFLSLLEKMDSVRMLYVSLDEITGLLDASLAEVLDAYENILGETFERLTSPVFLFVDEVQYDSKWGLALKSLYDRSKHIFICCTGSSAVSLQTNADVQRRVITEKLYPLSFPEYQMLQHDVHPVEDLQQRIKQAVYFSKDAKHAHDELATLERDVLQYWSRIDKMDVQRFLTLGTLPFALHYSNVTQAYDAISGLLDKIIFQDVENLKSFDVQTLHSIKRLLFLLADASDVLSVAKLPPLTGMESALTVQRVLAVLEQAEVLIRAMPYGSQGSKLNKPSKYLFISPAIRMALLGIVGKEATFHMRIGKLLEDFAAMHFSREFMRQGVGSLSYDAAQGGADFILQIANKTQIAIEIGMGDKGPDQVRKAMAKIHCDYGIVIADGNLGHSEKDNILFLPLKWFLMM